MRRQGIRFLEVFPWLLADTILLTLLLTLPAFQRPSYWLLLSRQYFKEAALALALTPIILTGGIDLSVGSITVLASVIIGALSRDAGWPIGWAACGGVLVGLLAGLGNGVLVRIGILPLVATLATRELYRGLAKSVSGDNVVRDFPPILFDLWRARPLGLPLAVWGIGLLLLFTYLVVHRSWVGRLLYALGDNEQAALFAGAPVGAIKVGLYAFSGLVAGLCGVALVMDSGTALADAEKSLELVAIACVVMGGVRITGGAGHVLGAFLGILTVTALLAGLLSISSTWRDTLMGALLVVVAMANEVTSRLAARIRGRVESTRNRCSPSGT
jgi:ribose/xylose/arabinose/galactoside ABC-type transport system permease subunit